MLRLKKYKLSDLTEIIGGGTPKTSITEYWNGNIPWLSVVDFGGDNKKVYATEKSITERGLKNSSTKMLKKGQLIISARGTVGELAMLGKDMAFNQSCYGLNAIEDLTTNDFLYYLLKYELSSIKSVTHGSVFDTITRQSFDQLEVEIPEDLPTQTRIASILSSLDNKIELNRRINHALEQIAQTLFKKYFVDDIDPENLPEGWRWGKIGEFINSISVTHKFRNEEIIFLNTGDIYEGKVLHSNLSVVDTLPGQAKKSIQKHDILLSEIRPANKRFAYINFDAQNYVVSTKLMVLRSVSTIDSLFFYFILTSNETLSYLQNLAEARSGTFPQITFDQVKEIDFLLPTKDVLDSFIERALMPVYKMIFNNEKENESLIKIRDSLLPKLMSGEIEVNAVENEFAE